MPSVETVSGPVDLADLGATLMHEHVFVMWPEALDNFGKAWNPRPYWDEEERVADAIDKLRRLSEAGIRTIVDPTVYGLGRNVERIKRVSDAVDINIIVATGIYARIEMPDFLAWRTDDAIIELLVREVTNGINGSTIRAAFLKCAVEAHGLIVDVPRILRITAETAKSTGVPVMLHTNAKTGADAFAELVRLGVDPRLIVVAHAGDSNDLPYLRGLADNGASLGFDRFGKDFFNPHADRMRTLTALITEGYADRIHLGHDAACFADFKVENSIFEGSSDFFFVSEHVIPELQEAGFADAIDQMMTDNPRRFFAQSGALV